MTEASPLELQDRLEIPRIALAIRLRLGRGGLYIFAVESEDVRQAVISALTKELNTEVTWREVRITPKRYDLFLYLQHYVREEHIDTRHTIFSVTGLPETIAAQQKQYPDKQPSFCVNALNVRREVIPDHNLSVVLWVDEATRKRLPYDAKDFWAFQMETRFFRDAAARQHGHFSPPPPAPLDKDIAELRDLLKRYHEQRPDDAGGIGSVAFALGDKLYRRSRFREAQDTFMEALRLYREVGSVAGQADALNSLGGLARMRGEIEQARGYHQEALGLYREVGSVGGQATALNSLGGLARMRGEIEQARSYHQEALELYRKVEDVEGQATALNYLGVLAQVRGEVEQAQRSYQEALGLYRKVGSVVGQANVLNELGVLARVRGEVGQAQRSYQEALGLYREVGSVVGQANVLNDLGVLAQVRGEIEQAQRYHQEALGLFRELNAPEGQAEALRELGSVSRQTGDLMLAASYLQEALTLFQAIGARLEITKTEELLRQVHAQLVAA